MARGSNRTGVEENTLAILESIEADDTQDANDDSMSLSLFLILFGYPETVRKSW